MDTLFDDITFENEKVGVGSGSAVADAMAFVTQSELDMQSINAELSKIEAGSLGYDTLDLTVEQLAAEEGGIHGLTVEAISSTIGHVCQTLNYKPTSPIVPSRETFDDVNNRGALTVEVIGKVKSIATKVIGAIRNTVVALGRKLLTYIMNWMTNGEKITDAAQEIIDGLDDDTKAKSAGKDKIDHKGAAKLFIDPAGATTAVDNAAAMLTVAGQYLRADTVAAGDLDKVLSSPPKGTASKTKIDAKYLKAAFGDTKDITVAAMVPVSGHSIVTIYNNKFTGADKDKSKYYTKTKYIKMAKESTGSKISPMNPAQIESLMDSVTGYDFDGAKELRKDVDTIMSDLEKQLTEIIADLRKDGKGKKVRGKKLIVNGLIQSASVYGSKPLSVMGKTAKTAISYAEDSISALEGPGDA